jgi:hypothetical protein
MATCGRKAKATPPVRTPAPSAKRLRAAASAAAAAAEESEAESKENIEVDSGDESPDEDPCAEGEESEEEAAAGDDADDVDDAVVPAHRTARATAAAPKLPRQPNKKTSAAVDVDDRGRCDSCLANLQDVFPKHVKPGWWETKVGTQWPDGPTIMANHKNQKTFPRLGGLVFFFRNFRRPWFRLAAQPP